MRYFYLGFILTVATIIAVLGFRGHTFRQPPLEIFPDMVRQPKIRPQTPSEFFDNGMSSQPYPSNTVAKTAAYSTGDGKSVYPYEDVPFNTGRIHGTTNFVDLMPVKVTAQLINRGQERFNIYCSPCHGPAGNGQGVTSKLGMGGVADLHQQRIVTMTDGQIFYTITHGSPAGLMGPYGPIIPVEDRWAIVSYVRALQRSQLATIADVPDAEKAALNK